MEAVALHDFNPTEADDQLPFKKESILKILMKDKNWYRAEQEGKEGFVPANYIQMKPHGWYVGKMRRIEAETQLVAQPHEGAFLIRDSESIAGDFTLSVKYDNSVQHFEVHRDGAGKYFLWVIKFNSLNQLVEYHRAASVSRSQTIYLKDMILEGEPYRAAFDYTAQEASEISFKQGEIIRVTEQFNQHWWIGKANGQNGQFPSSYVTPVDKK